MADPRENVEVQYDRHGRVISRTNLDGSQTDYAYNPNGQLVSLLFNAGAQTQHSYDSFGRLIRQTNPDGSQETFDEDQAVPVSEAMQPGL